MSSPTIQRRLGLAGGLAIKAPVRAASATNITLSGTQTVGGVVLVADDRVLLTGQTDTTENGIYDVSTGGWTRAIDCNGSHDLDNGTIGLITSGTYSNQFWLCTTTGTIQFGTTALTFQLGIPALAVLAATSGASLIGFIQSDTGAVGTTLQAKNRQVLSVADFGAVGDGTDETTKLRLAVAAAELRGCDLVWPATSAGYKCQMITLTTGGCRMIGESTKIVQTLDSTCVQIGGADYTVSAVFFFRPGANNCTVSGFEFEQAASMNVAAGYTSTANFAPIVGYRADNLVIENNKFDCLMGKAWQIRGGNFVHIGRNYYTNCGFTAAVGFTADAYYGDAVGVASPFYSPIGLYVSPQQITGSSVKPQASHSIHLTGCNDFLLEAPIINGLTDATQGAIRIYASDFGVSDIAGNVVSRMKGQVLGAQVRGTCLQALEVLCDGGGTDVTADIIVDGLNADVVGIGAKLERFIGGRLVNSHIRSSASPLWVGDSVERSEVTGYYECYNAGTSLKTIFISSTAEMLNINWHDMTVVMGGTDEYALDTITAAFGPENGRFKGITFIVNTTSTSSRVVQLAECRGSFDFSDITFDIRATGISNRYLFSVTEASGAVLTINCDNVKVVSSNSTVYTRRGGLVNASDDVFMTNCDFGGMDITCTSDVHIMGGQLSHNSTTVPPLSVTNAVRVKVSNCHIEEETAGNLVIATFIACTKVKLSNCSVVAANSTQPVIRATTSGVVEVDKVDVSNVGTGVAYGITGTGLIAGDLGAYAKDATLWTDANRLAATIMQPGTRFWNSSDTFDNTSDGTNWRSPAGAVT